MKVSSFFIEIKGKALCSIEHSPGLLAYTDRNLFVALQEPNRYNPIQYLLHTYSVLTKSIFVQYKIYFK